MNENFMKEKPVFPLLVSMALPMVISMLVNSLYNIVDSFFVAQISEDAMTALSLVYPVQNFVNAVAIGFGIGLNAVISYYLGAGDKKAAGCVIHYDPWWNLSAENQATDRTYRIGQKNNVQVYKLITKNSIEEKIYELQQKKAKLADNMLSTQNTFISQLSKEDIMKLFG